MALQPDFDIFDPQAQPPDPAWFWSTANHRWRLPPAPFRWDRFALHIPAGILVAAVALAQAVAGLLIGIWLGAPLPAAIVGAILALGWLLTSVHLFLRYEETESGFIWDGAYPDIAGFFTGLLATGGISGSICITLLLEVL